MIWKGTFPFILIIGLILKSSYAKQELSDEDIEKTSELVVNALSPLLDLYDYTIEDVPDKVKHLVAKYYLISFRGIEPLDTLEQMGNDYDIIQNSKKDLEEYLGHIAEMNAQIKKATEKYLDEMVKTLDFRLQVVSAEDALKFLIYQGEHPDIMKIVSLMVRKHYNAYVKDRAEEKEHPKSSDRDTSQAAVDDDDDFDLRKVIREFVTTHGRLELIKRILYLFEPYLPPLDLTEVNESTLDYLDDLHELLQAKSNSAWGFIKGSAYKTMTDKWIISAENLLQDFLTLVPLQELFNFFDTIVLNSNDRRAFLIYRYQASMRGIDLFSNEQNRKGTRAPAESFDDVFNLIKNGSIFALTSIRDIFRDTVNGVYSEVNKLTTEAPRKLLISFLSKISEDDFLEYINELLAPYDMSTNDLSEELRYIIKRTFTRINFIQGRFQNDLEKKILERDVLNFRKNLEKLRDAIGVLIPEQSEANHFEWDIFLWSLVNEFGPSVLEMEQLSVNIFNFLKENSADKEMIAEKIGGTAEKMDLLYSIFETTGTRPSDLLKMRLSEVEEIIDDFVEFATFQ